MKSFAFLYPMKTENQRFSLVFRGFRKGDAFITFFEVLQNGAKKIDYCLFPPLNAIWDPMAVHLIYYVFFNNWPCWLHDFLIYLVLGERKPIYFISRKEIWDSPLKKVLSRNSIISNSKSHNNKLVIFNSNHKFRNMSWVMSQVNKS